MTVDEQFMTVAEVSELLKLNPQTVRNWITAGTLAHTRVGRRVLIRKDDLDALAGADTGDDLLTVAEVASELRLNEQTIRNWMDAGKLPHIRVGRRVRIRRSDLDELLNAGASGQPQAELSADDFWSGDRPVGEGVIPDSKTRPSSARPNG
jgi:excisionase family DNA binding protein